MKSPNSLNANQNTNNEASKWDFMGQETVTPQIDKLKVKPSPSVLMDQYGDRLIYTDKNGKEVKVKLNPWAMAKDVTKSPENMMILGQTFQHMSKKWKNNEQNPSEKVIINKNGEVEKTGWENAIRVKEGSMIDTYLKQFDEPPRGGWFENLTADPSTLIEEYGERIIYTSKNGVEIRMELNPLAMIDDALDNPDDMTNAGVALKKMATRWHNDERNPKRAVRINEDGKKEESGWENATRVDNSSALGRYIERSLKKQEAMFEIKDGEGMSPDQFI